MTVLARYGPAYPDAQEQSRAQTDLRRKLAHRRMDDARRLLVDTSDALASSEDLRSSLRAVARVAIAGLADWSVVDVLDRHNMPRRLAAAHADPHRQQAVDELRKRGAPAPARFDPLWDVVRTGRPRLEAEVTPPLRRALTHDARHAVLLQRLGLESLLVVPLSVGERLLGAITLVRGSPDARFDADDLALADAWARQCALFLNSIVHYTAERRAHLAAEAAARERTAALEHLADAVVIADAHGRIDFMNSAARALFGLDGAAPPQVLPLFGTNGHALDGASDPLQRAFREHVHVSAPELRVRRSDNVESVVEAFAAPLSDAPEQQDGAVLSLHDVTAWRERERTRDESFANASHDLRTPVAAISGAIEVFLRDAPRGIPPPLYHMLLIIEQEADRMRALVDDVLELTGVEAGRVHLRPMRRDLGLIARQAARAIEPLAAEAGQHVVIELPRHPVRASVDGPRLERALVNLLSNAQRYAPRGGTIRLRLERRRGEVVLSVADDGPGIPRDEQARIFERLYRGPGAGMHRGSGLGLPIARAMVELHHGRMWVESTPGAGATFFVALPLPRQRRSPA